MEPDQDQNEKQNDDEPSQRLSSDVSPPPADLYLQPRFCPAGSGWRWIVDSFAMFKVNWLIWTVMILIWFVMMAVANFLPFVNIVASLFGPVFTGGMMLGAAAQDAGEHLRVTHLFDGFKQQVGSLFSVGAFYLLGFFIAMILTGLLLMLLLGGEHVQQMMQGMEQGVPPDMAASSMALLLAPLILMALILPLIMALWFAPALVVFHKVSAFEAMKLSFSACLSNILPFLLYGLVVMFLSILAAIPFFLGFVVLFPVLFISQYVSYKEIFR
jgi:uncharacterized membrane protein